MSGLARRRLYKPERAPARKRGVLHKEAPVGCLGASGKEIEMAVAAICEIAHVTPGQGSGYNPIRDEYTIVGKDKRTGKAQDFVIEGVAVAALISTLRQAIGAKFDKSAATKALSRVPRLIG